MRERLMNNRYPLAFLYLLFGLSLCLQAHAASCLDQSALTKLDQQYEDALVNGDAAFLADLLADDFIWVHNLASLIETKSALVARVKTNTENFKARRSTVLSAHRLDNTSVLNGTSLVERVNGVGLRSSRYQFMRTYVVREDKCYLLAVQTMKVWSSEQHEMKTP